MLQSQLISTITLQTELINAVIVPVAQFNVQPDLDQPF